MTGGSSVLWAALMLSISPIITQKCLNVTEVSTKRYFVDTKFESKPLPITIDVSERITHQITSYIFKIFLEEELGYTDVRINQLNATFPSTTNIRKRLEWSAGGGKFLPPEAMINLEVWRQAEAESVPWNQTYKVRSVGVLSPPGRFGWFIPKSLVIDQSEDSYWKTFTTPRVERYSLNETNMEFVQKHTRDPELRYYCQETFCINGVFTPPWCQNQTCATLLAGPSDATKFVEIHIKKLKLLVQVIWVGPHLESVVAELTPRLAELKQGLVFVHFTPSVLVLPNDAEFASVSFPPCETFASDTGCKYDPHILEKFCTSSLDNAAYAAYTILNRIKFNQLQYKQMLEMYKSEFFKSRNSLESVKATACNWLKKNDKKQEWGKSGMETKIRLFIGGIFPLESTKVIPYGVNSINFAALAAVNDVNRNNSLLQQYDIKLTIADGKCESDYVLKAFIDLMLNHQHSRLVGILGPACSDTLEPLTGLTSLYRTMVISYSAEGATVSDRKKYPYFFRTVGNNNQYQQVYLQLLKKLGWRRVAAITEDGQKYSDYLTHLQDLLSSRNFTFVMNRKFPHHREKHSMKNYLQEMKDKNVRIIIGDVFDDAARDMMCQAYKLGMTARQSYVWFLPPWLSPHWYVMKDNSTDDCTTQQMLEAINGHLSLSHKAWATDDSVMQTNLTVGEWKKQFEKTLPTIAPELSSYAGYAYDAVWMYALALEQLLKEDPSAIANLHSEEVTLRFEKILENTDFNGVSGRIQFRGNNTRTSVVEVRQWIGTTTNVVGIFEPDISPLNRDPMAGTLFLNESDIQWLNPEGRKPKDGTIHCFLGLADYFGFEDCDMFLLISNMIAIIILALVGALAFLAFKRSYDKKYRLNKKIMDYIGLDLLNVGTLEKWEIPRDKVVMNRKLGEGAFGYVYGGEAYFEDKGWVAVAVKTLKVGSTPDEKLEFLCEAEVMKRFDHTNIVRLLGVCTKTEPVYTVMEFMLYGDLKTFLLARRYLVNEKLGEDADEVSNKKLTGMALDVARALSYLAEMKFVHRDVASRNCLVNTSRVVKLGDFGMTRPMYDKDYYKFTRKGMLPVRWMAPESLEQGLFTTASDIWSFGVLLFEIITFGSFPFQGMGNLEVLEYVKAGNTLTVPPKVKPQAEALIRACWNLDYNKRPMAAEIVEFIANNPRLLHPCLDVPLASVQTDDSGPMDIRQPEMLRRYTFSLRNRNSSTGSQSTNGISIALQGDGSPRAMSAEEGPLLEETDKYVIVPSN